MARVRGWLWWLTGVFGGSGPGFPQLGNGLNPYKESKGLLPAPHSQSSRPPHLSRQPWGSRQAGPLGQNILNGALSEMQTLSPEFKMCLPNGRLARKEN